MIRLRSRIDRALERRWLGLLFFLLLALLLVFVAAHPIADEFVASAALVCAVAALLAMVPLLAGSGPLRSVATARRSRPPPAAPSAELATVRGSSQRSLPLRR
jgi:hypothetical protein